MNRLEGEARPHVTKLVIGEAGRLSAEALTSVARWFSLKVLVAEHEKPDISLTPQCDRDAFSKDLTIPDYFRVYVGHNISGNPLFYMRHSHCIAYSPDGPKPELDGTTKNVQVVTFVAGKAIFQAVCSRIDGVALEDRAIVLGFHDRCRIWPDPPADCTTPIRPRLDGPGIVSVATILQRYIERGKTTWIEG